MDTSGYDPLVYENTTENWFKIVGMLILFYIFQGLHWWANFELGTTDGPASTNYNIIIFASAVLVIMLMLIKGNEVNKLKLAHEFYTEKISEENQKQKDARAKAAQKAKDAAKKAYNNWTIESWDNFHTLRKGWVHVSAMPIQSQYHSLSSV